MVSSIFRVLVAFVLACLAAAAVCVGLASPPESILPAGAGSAAIDLSASLSNWLAVATHIAIFAAPFALIAAAAGEWLRLRGWLYYALVGLAISGMGLWALVNGENPGDPSIWNSYAAATFSVAGILAGLAYWLAGGQFAGDDEPEAPAVTTAVTMPSFKIDPGPSRHDKLDGIAIERLGPDRSLARLVTARKLMPSDFAKIASALNEEPKTARKTGFVAARKATETETVETEWNGTETSNTAFAGDWIVTNLKADKTPLHDRAGNANTYVISSVTFPKLYEDVGGENDFGAIYKATGTVEILPLPGGFDILAPWGERQVADAGYLLLNRTDVYGNNAETFNATYEMTP